MGPKGWAPTKVSTVARALRVRQMSGSHRRFPRDLHSSNRIQTGASIKFFLKIKGILSLFTNGIKNTPPGRSVCVSVGADN